MFAILPTVVNEAAAFIATQPYGEGADDPNVTNLYWRMHWRWIMDGGLEHQSTEIMPFNQPHHTTERQQLMSLDHWGRGERN